MITTDDALKRDLTSRLAIDAPAVVEEILKLSLRQLDSEERRHATLTGKAQSVIGQTGVTVGLVSSLIAAVLVREHQTLRQLHPFVSLAAAYAGLGAIIFGALAVVFALLAQRVAPSRDLSSDDILSEEELFAAHATRDRHLRPDPSALQRYRRFIISHVWTVRSHLKTRNEQIASNIQTAQMFFACFVFSVGVVGISLAGLAIALQLEASTPTSLQ